MNKAKLMMWVCVGVFVVGPAWAENQLRRCVEESCQQYASSNQWNFCPHCGAALPEAQAFEAQAESTLIGNVFTFAGGGFTIERPTQQWTAIYGEPLDEINPAADLFLSLDDEYCFMVMDEFAATGWTLEEYAKLVEPGFDEAQVVFKRPCEIGGLPGVRLRFDGKIDGIPMIWDQAILNRGDHYYQINAWSATWQFDEAFEQVIETAHASFAVPPSVLEGNHDAEPAQEEPAPGTSPGSSPESSPADDGAPRAPRG